MDYKMPKTFIIIKGSTNLVLGHSFRVHSLVRGCGPGVLRTPGY